MSHLSLFQGPAAGKRDFSVTFLCLLPPLSDVRELSVASSSVADMDEQAVLGGTK
jgi:hypothetical protein